MRTKVRRATADDAAAVAKLLISVGNVHSEGRPDIYRSPLTKHDENSAAKLIAESDYIVFVADCEGSICGELICRIEQQPGDQVFRPRKWLYIDDLCVEESERGTGVGRALYEHVLAYARMNGFYNVTLNVWEGNGSALKFYRSLGLKVQKYGMEIIL